MPGKKIGLGSQMLIGATTPSTVILGGLLSVDGPNFSREMADITEIRSSTVDPYIEETPGYISIDPVTVELAYYSTDDAGQTLLKAAFMATTGYAFKLFRGSTLDDAYNFKAHVTGIGTSVPGRSDMITRTITLNVQGSTTSLTDGIG